MFRAFLASVRLLAWGFLLCGLPWCSAQAPSPVKNVIVITWDGFRWQELFAGADEDLFDPKAGGVRNRERIARQYWKSTPQERRETLLPFLWGTVAKKGQIFGDAAKNCLAELTNGQKFSYPGYNEMFSGQADPRIDSNAKRNNPNLTVLEYLHTRPGFAGKVAAFCTWDVFPFIFRTKTSQVPVFAGWEPFPDTDSSDRHRLINALAERMPRYWENNVFDVVTMEHAKEYLVRKQPRVLYIGLGETDEWGHGRRYDMYLDSAQQSDRFLAELWELTQKLPAYRDQTAFLITTDHGRGKTRVDWTDHGPKVPGAERIWLAVLGPTTPAWGVRENVKVTQSQVAATIAHWLGEDFRSASPKAAPPLPGVHEVPAKK